MPRFDYSPLPATLEQCLSAVTWTLRRSSDGQDMEALDSDTYCTNSPANLFLKCRTCMNDLALRKTMHSTAFEDYYLEGTITYANGDT